MALAQILLRGGTSAQWTAANPVLAAREAAIDTTTHRMKIGDGKTAWSALPWSSMAVSDVQRLEAAATALEGAATPYDAATATVLGNPNGAARKVLTDTIDAVGEASVGDDESPWWGTLLSYLRGAFLRLGRQTLDPRDFGAVGDGVTDDTAAVQACLDAAVEGSRVVLRKNFKITTVSINKRYWTITGPGGFVDGELVIGSATGANQDQFWSVKGVKFTRFTESVEGTAGIRLLKSRRGLIDHCVFDGHDKAIYRPAISGGANFHSTAQIKVTKNDFLRVNYAWYSDFASGEDWQSTSDCKFIANNINLSYVTGVWAKGIDGFVITNNVFFSTSFNSSDAAKKAMKENNIYLGQSDWVVIGENNLFEAGLEAIKLVQPKHFTVSDNLIAWSGQREMRDAIAISGANTYAGNVHDNTIGRFTRHAVSINASGTGFVNVHDNVYEYDSANPTYYGTPALSTVEHFGTFEATTNTIRVTERNEATAGIYPSMKGSIGSQIYIGGRSTAVANLRVSKTITAATALAKLTSASSGGNAGAMGGILHVLAKNVDASNANTTSYVLHAWKYGSSGSGSQGVSVVSSGGLTTGGGASHPSFTFSIDATGVLTATPVGSASGSFFFELVTIGDLKATAL